MISMARTFGAPVMEPPGKTAPRSVPRSTPSRSVPDTSETRWCTRRVGLEPGEAVDDHAAGSADPSQIVALEVHDHHVLGPLLRIAMQLGGARGVARAVLAARVASP